MDLGLAGKVALVTGAGRGIGRAIALTLAAEGVRVGVNDYYQDRAQAVAGEIERAGGKALPLQADVTDYEAVQRMTGVLVERFGRLDILVNNAGIPPQTGLGGAGGSGFGPPFSSTARTWRCRISSQRAVARSSASPRTPGGWASHGWSRTRWRREV
jgi:NAD(P)-dependent dehydrogenase (short-subunit alcohol dehydrogenase family)